MAAFKTILAALILLPSVALAQDGGINRCLPRDQMLEVLSVQFGEHVVATATMQGRPVEVTASSETGSWTLFITNPDTQLSCIVMDGQAWSAIKATWGAQI